MRRSPIMKGLIPMADKDKGAAGKAVETGKAKESDADRAARGLKPIPENETDEQRQYREAREADLGNNQAQNKA